MENVNIQYKELLRKILDEGFEYTDKSRGVQRKQIASTTLNIDLQQEFPAINLKKLYWNGIVGELIWFLKGDTNIKYLVDNNIHIWDKDAYNYYLKQYPKTHLSYDDWLIEIGNIQTIGDLGRVYGAQWRKFTVHNVGPNDSFPIYVDQISNLIQGLKENPMGTRHLVTAWNPAELDDMALPPCHWSFEILVEPLSQKKRVAYYDKINDHVFYAVNKRINLFDQYLNEANIPKYQFTLKWHQRSVDTFLGLPFNIASYALLAHIIGKLTNMVPKALIGDLSNVHLYENSWEASRELIKRDPTKFELPKLGIMDHLDSFVSDDINNFINALRIQDFKLLDYESYDNIKVAMLAPNK